MINLRKKAGGFTIIEVMIVLTIAGLILLIVFLAVPALQRHSRNYDRKEAVAQMSAAMGEYYAAHSAYPKTETQICDFLQNYAGNVAGSPTSSCTPAFSGSGDCITVTYSRYDVCYHDSDHSSHGYVGPDSEISIILSHWCNSGNNYWAGDGTNPITSGGSAIDNQYSRYVVWMSLENAPVLCVDNFPNAS